MPAAFSGLRATPEASTASLLALTNPVLFGPPLEALGFHQGPCCQDLRNKSMFPNVPLLPWPLRVPVGDVRCSKGLESRGKEEQKAGWMIGEGAPLR